ncbi:hypothetical protein [Prosthecochloris sp. CIB 2401]|uniref:hypothetical protein n=1 Tax=Prosthecochloris sp. CIB 2401 TaxID=1868325 RepID=UPI00080AB0E2|nr:hypothetical protein [Prosthecochloris sp. CIB 2401]ANT64469.1 hypothetical protein Ptc2401_00674 [Prosthecochloris sp. CIB 2401]
MAEELNKPSGAPAPKTIPAKHPPTKAPEEGIAGDIPMLMENIGVLIDSTVTSVSDMLAKATRITSQTIDNVTLAINSDAVKKLGDNIGSASETAMQNVNAALNSEQLQNSITQLGNAVTTITDAIDAAVNSPQTREFMDNLGNGIQQLMSGAGAQIAGTCTEHHHKKAVEIPYSHKKTEPVVAQAPAAAPSKTEDIASAEAPALAKTPEPVQKPETSSAAPQKAIESETKPEPPAAAPVTTAVPQEEKKPQAAEQQKKPEQGWKNKQKRRGGGDPSRKGTFPRSKGPNK